jgi:short subunit dehydrogenase-like uncharacterized protein
MVYGATGYTGRLVVAESIARGLDVVLAGRDPGKLERIAKPLGFECRVVSLDDEAQLRTTLSDIAVVLHIAGPFSATARPMIDACLATGTHYLDVTGEIDVFESIARRGAEARKAGVMLLPGVGFDVVPTDCLAAHVATQVRDPHTLRLALAGIGGGVSRGTAKTSIESLGNGLRVRQDGLLQTRPMGSLERPFDFGAGGVRTIAMPLADVSTVFHSTGIPNIEVYVAASGKLPAILRASRVIAPLLRIPALQEFLKRQIDSTPEGPTKKERNATRVFILAEVSGADGETARALLETPSPYALTPVAALEAAERAAQGTAPTGFQTPATAFGPDFILELDGCRRTDLEADSTRPFDTST